jgi:hypothetical protein
MSNVIVRSALVLFVVAVFTGSLFAQRGENHFELRQPPNPFNPMFGIVQPAVRGWAER